MEALQRDVWSMATSFLPVPLTIAIHVAQVLQERCSALCLYKKSSIFVCCRRIPCFYAFGAHCNGDIKRLVLAEAALDLIDRAAAQSITAGDGIAPCLHRNKMDQIYVSRVLDYDRNHKIIKTGQLCQMRRAWNTKQGGSFNTGSRDRTEMKPTRGRTSQRTWIYHLVLTADFVTQAWTSQVSFRELQRCYPEARRWLSWDQTDLRAIMKPSPCFDILTVALTAWAPASCSHPAPGSWSSGVSPTCRSPAPACTQLPDTLHRPVGVHIWCSSPDDFFRWPRRSLLQNSYSLWV